MEEKKCFAAAVSGSTSIGSSGNSDGIIPAILPDGDPAKPRTASGTAANASFGSSSKDCGSVVATKTTSKPKIETYDDFLQMITKRQNSALSGKPAVAAAGSTLIESSRNNDDSVAAEMKARITSEVPAVDKSSTPRISSGTASAAPSGSATTTAQKRRIETYDDVQQMIKRRRNTAASVKPAAAASGATSMGASSNYDDATEMKSTTTSQTSAIEKCTTSRTSSGTAATSPSGSTSKVGSITVATIATPKRGIETYADVMEMIKKRQGGAMKTAAGVSGSTAIGSSSNKGVSQAAEIKPPTIPEVPAVDKPATSHASGGAAVIASSGSAPTTDWPEATDQDVSAKSGKILPAPTIATPNRELPTAKSATAQDANESPPELNRDTSQHELRPKSVS
ncbi:unnamed protein product, partial [Mesorhabditis spiculigera]